jgi:hypothetical protein
VRLPLGLGIGLGLGLANLTLTLVEVRLSLGVHQLLALLVELAARGGEGLELLALLAHLLPPLAAPRQRRRLLL